MYGNRRSSKVHTAFFSVFGANGCFASYSRAIASNVLEPLARAQGEHRLTTVHLVTQAPPAVRRQG